MTETRAPEGPPPLENECTVEDIHCWITTGGEQLGKRVPDLDNNILEPMQILIDVLWETDEPKLSPHTLVVLASLSNQMGSNDEAHDSALQLLIPFLSMPKPMRQLVQVNISEGSFKLMDDVDVIDRT